VEIKLNDKYKLESGIRFLTGSQALVRLPIVQIRKDNRNNINTACYISGYRGSPLGGYDQQILKNIDYLKISIFNQALTRNLRQHPCGELSNLI
jgi:indolepyruvate ferredoxin oxidoreductase